LTPPETAVWRFAAACVLGAVLGAWYGFLRPLRPKMTALSDSLFVLGSIWAFLQLGFGVCQGDIRLGYTAGLAVGGICFDKSIGLLLRPVFSGFWKLLGGIWQVLTLPLKKFFEIAKKLFAYVKKWVTIKWNNRRHNRRESGGVTHGRNQKFLPPRSDRFSAQPSADQDRGDRGHHTVYGGIDHLASGAESYRGADKRYAGRSRKAGTGKSGASG
jgi:hypothetical protein